ATSAHAEAVAAGALLTLTGTVKSAAQKTLAGAIAKKNAEDFKVVNQLKVG
ncbi:BON domain-containing protein, partial [bacterium]